MSTCPENDLHSVYLDGELPPAYMADYEAHIAECPECQKKLASLRSLREAFSTDSLSMNKDEKFLNESFDRLKARMSYIKVTRETNVLTLTGEKVRGALKYVATGAVAAAVVALIIPVRMNSKAGDASAANFQPVARTNMVLPANANVQVDGALDTATLTQLFSENGMQAQGRQVSMQNNTRMGFAPSYPPVPYLRGQYGQGPYGHSPYAPARYGHYGQYGQYGQFAASRAPLASYNVFGPIPETNAMMPSSSLAQDSEQKQKGFSFHVSSPLGNISLEIGNGN